MRSARLSGVAALAAAGAGTALWCSLGVLTVTDAGPRAARVGLLPPWWQLAACVGAAVAIVWSLRLSRDRALPLFFSWLLMVPWLPVPLPTACLAWTGPVAWIVWAATAGAVLAAGGARGNGYWWLSWCLIPSRATWMAFAAAFLIYAATAVRLAPLLPGGDEPHYLVITQSLLRDGDLRIENNHRRGDYLEYFKGTLRPDFLRRGQDRQIYSIHMPGVSALVLPAYAIGGYRLVPFALALLSAAATAVVWRMAFVLTGEAAAAWFAWAATGLTAPFLFLAFTVYPDGPGAVVVVLAFAALISLHVGPPRRTAWWAAVSVLPAALPWFHPRYAVLAASLGVIFAWRAARGPHPVGRLVAYLAVPLASAAGWFGYFFVIYGRPDPSIAYGHYTQMSLGRIPTGLLGLLVDQQYGLLPNAPVFAAGIAGLWALARRHARLALEWLAIVVPYALVTSAYHMWWGGFSSPARFLGPVLLLCGVPVAMAWSSIRHPVTRALLAVGLAVSLALAVLFAGVEGGQFAFNIRNQLAPWLVWTGAVADLAHAVPGLFRLAPGAALIETLIWAGAVLIAWGSARALAARSSSGPGASALALTLALGVAAMGSLSAAWRFEHVSGRAPGTSQLRALRMIGAGRDLVGITFEPAALAASGTVAERLKLGPGPIPGPPRESWLSLPQVSAGRYRLWIDNGVPGVSFDATLWIGGADAPADTLRFERLPAGASSREIVLPVGVSSLVVRGEADARAAIRSIWLQPVSIVAGAKRISALEASSARRFGGMVIFGLGRSVYLEPEGLWTAGGAQADLVVVSDTARPDQRFVLRAGPVATPVRVVAGGIESSMRLASGETFMLSVALRPGEPMLIRVRADQGFRPSDLDPKSTDMRMLGVRLEPRSE